jgi:hypothetical protein
VVLATLLVPAGANASTGDLLRQVSVADSGNGRGMAFDGQHLFYTLAGSASIFETDLDGDAVQAIPSPVSGGPLAWDGTALWTMDYSSPSDILYRIGLDGTVLSHCSLAEANPGDPGVAGVERFPDGLDFDKGSLWLSNDVDSRPPWVVEVDTSCRVRNEFQPPTDSLGDGPSGVEVVGDGLWAAYPRSYQVQQMTQNGTLTGVSFSTGTLQLEDLAFDSSTFAPTCALWGNNASSTGNVLTAYEVPCTFGAVPPPLNVGDYRIARRAQEPSLVVDPKDPQHVIVGFNTVDDGYNHCSFAASWDGGKTWTSPRQLGSVGGQGSLGDPSLAFAPNGNIFYTCMTRRTHLFDPTDFGIGVYVSRNGGKTFKGVSLADTGLQADDVGFFDDQPTLAVGPDGRPHICFAAVNSSSDVQTVQVLDGRDTRGEKWSQPRVAPNTPNHDTRGCGIAVTGTGRLWVSWWDQTSEQARVAYRDPGRRRFVNMGSIGPKQAGPPDDLGWQVQLAADPRLNATGVVAIWPTWMDDGGVTLLAYTTTTTWYGDCGANDTLPCVVSPTGADIREPAVAWGSDGKIAIGFYLVDKGALTYWVGRADDLNQPFGYRAAASSATKEDSRSVRPFSRLGDYTSVAEGSDGSLYAAWSDTRNGRQQLWGAS